MNTKNVEAFKKGKCRKLRRKECHEMKRPAKLTLRAEDKGFGGKTIFRTARGWVDAKDLTDRTPAEELARMREDAAGKTYLPEEPSGPSVLSRLQTSSRYFCQESDTNQTSSESDSYKYVSA